jgi:RNA polymerase sigma-70 factor (ECF subfamily)
VPADPRQPAADGTVEQVLARAFADEWSRVVAILIGHTGDWDLAEEAAQEAFAQALTVWARDGVPDRPRAWLVTTGRNRAIDRLRRERVGAAKLRELAPLLAVEQEVASDLDAVESGVADDRLRLIFTCCHPALAFDAQVTLALRTLCGLSVAELARAFHVSEPTMAKRLVRTRQKISTAGIPYRVPPPDRLAERTTAVLGVIYLLFNEGYTATAGPSLLRLDLCEQAVRLAQLVAELMPDDAEAAGLAALLLLQHSRAAARVDAEGVLVPLAEQDRSVWDDRLVAAGLATLRSRVGRATLGPYQLQALIAACHATAARPEDTDWAVIVSLYDQLEALVPSPAVRLNRAVAVAMRDGPEPALASLSTLDGTFPGHLLPAVRADLLRRLGRTEEARQQYVLALSAVVNDGERRYLQRQADRL